MRVSFAQRTTVGAFVAAWLFLNTFHLCAQDSTSSGNAASSVDDIIRMLRNAQQRTLQATGGLKIDYTLDVEQDKNEPYFVWQKGLAGLFVAKWPLIKSRVEGEFFGISELDSSGRVVNKSVQLVREANYDFEQQVSIARDGTMVGQVGNFRHTFSANTCFPFVLQCYEQMNQFYVPQDKNPYTDYWLPAALEDNPYTILGIEEVSGNKCHILNRGGFDRIWLSLERGCVICKREINYGDRQPLRERLLHEDLRELGGGIWIPFKQSQEVYDEGGKLLFKITVRIAHAQAGSVGDDDVKVVLDGSMRKVEDFISGQIHFGNGVDDERFSRAVAGAKNTLVKRSWFLTMVLLNTAILGAVMLLLASIKKTRSA
eukprot:TRINITY_DN2036_c0_g1_i12.p1 TRINITY_DN2036_c0_g1~~TRINITY_DN2036_c0_g1_i12.p1  ORF type:complete len:372 (+),score=24.49 TRINITY_DN2036_c0_g1_i12:172-1287(+)